MKLAGRRILVTGGAGFIGRHVARRLRELGAHVTTVDKQLDPRGTWPAIHLDLTAPRAVDHALREGTEAVVHLAARTSVLGSLEQPVETFEHNVAVTAALLERTRVVGCDAFVFASTNAVVGDAHGRMIDETIPLAPLTPYGATKAACEMLMSSYTAAYGVRGVALRLSNVYGPAMSGKDSVIPRLIRAARSGGTFTVYGDGTQVRDYVYIDDVVAAVVMGLTSDVSGPVVVGSGVSTSVVDLLDLARQVTGADIAASHVPAKPGEMPRVVVSAERAASNGWQPSVMLPEGLAATWEAWTEDGDDLAAASA